MEEKKLLAQLEEIAAQLDIELRWDDGKFTGGSCRLRNKRVLLINRSLPTFLKIEVLCRELSESDLSGIFILPAIREKLSTFR